MTKEEGREKKITREMLSWTDSVWQARGVPEDLRELAHIIHVDVREIDKLAIPRFKAKPGVSPSEAVREYKEKKTRAARQRIAKKTEEFAKLVKKTPQYSNIVFKCVADYEKCREHMGKYNPHCMFAYFICMARQILPIATKVSHL